MHSQSAIERAGDAVGGASKLAELLGVSAQVVSNWKSRGAVPFDRCVGIERLTGVRRWDLRPDDWMLMWPELIGAEGAPPIPEPTEPEKARV